MQQPNKIKQLSLTLLFAINVTCLFAQQTFKYRAVIQKVDTSGFYTMPLTPDILAKCQTGLADIRLFDQNGKFVPYIFGDQLPVKDQSNFIVFPQINTTPSTDTVTTFIIQNKAQFTISGLYIKLRNTAVHRTVNLSGSDDLQKWYAIEENLVLAESGSTNNNHGIYEQALNFPASTYRYFKIQVNNQHKDAVAILQAGIYKRQFVDARYSQIPTPVFIQKDSAKISRIIIRFNEPYPVNKIQLDIVSQKFYKRRVDIYIKTGEQFELLENTEISSSTTVVNLPFSVKTKVIKLDVFNEDNLPLFIKAVHAYGLAQRLIGYLEKGQQYQLLFGDLTASAPNYDLKFFADSLQRNLSQEKTGVIENNPLYQPKQTKKDYHLPAWAIWIAIMAVILVLVLLTLKMIQEVNKRQLKEKSE